MDAVLAAHHVGPGLTPRRFELAGLRTASVRDQMVRAMVITERLHAAGTIGPGCKPLLVIGGGAGGVTAAIHAAELGAEVVLCEKEGHYFSRQAESDRLLDPGEYDWPQPHWQQRIFPWHAPAMPLRYEALPAWRLAREWEKSFAHWRRSSRSASRLAGRLNTELQASDLKETTQHVVASGTAFPKGQTFAAVLSFAGMLREKCRVPEQPAKDETAFEGFPYWGRDPYGADDLGLPGRKTLRVLISGGGDGALQDFIRVLTGLTARECAKALGVGAVPEALAMASAEDLGRRAHAWRGRSAPLHGSLVRWQQAFELAVQAQWKRWSAADRQRLAAQVLRAGVQVTLVHRCAHFDHSFALNRYLVLLLARLHARARRVKLDSVLRSGHEVCKVVGADTAHRCGQPENCHGLPHRVHVRAAVCSPEVPSIRTAALTDTFDCVLIRHGVEPNRLLGHALVGEHLLPHHVPD